jgi:aminoglycoside 3-N-acetyltransferase
MLQNSSMTSNSLTLDLHDAGVRPGMVLTVHSSLKSIGHVEGGAATVVQTLLEAVGDGGTLLFPALTFKGSLTLFLRENQTVDLRRSPATTGAIPRAAAAHPLARQSSHPTHSAIAIGPAVDLLLSGRQSGQGPCGTESPFHKAAMAGGFILLIGVTNAANTTLHCVEEMAAPYMNQDGIFSIRSIDRDGNSHDFEVKGYPVGLSRQFDAVNDGLIREGAMTCHHLGLAPLWLIHGRRMIESVSAWLADDPYLLAPSANPSLQKGNHP